MKKISAIKVENLSKMYRIQTVKPAFTLRDKLTEIGKPKLKQQDFWALKNLTFEVYQGEVLGVIGKNGSGKSTLLKILSRITEPTGGKVTLRGRVASLLEVGTGFNPELTGRENIFLNGAILGMTKREITNKFNEIVAFSGVETFLDTPVKRYSSGMYVRLAFAVAAHLESEILLVDEVLAVGDAEFQEKCIGKMNSITRDGRTVIFVSHNLEAVRLLCHRAILINRGKLVMTGKPRDVIQKYISHQTPHKSANEVEVLSSKGIIKKAWIENAHGELTSTIPSGSSMIIKFSFKANEKLINPSFGFNISDRDGRSVASLASYLISKNTYTDCTEGIAICTVDKLPLLPGNYLISLGLGKERGISVDIADFALQFTVIPYDVFNSGIPMESGHGVIFFPVIISLEPQPLI